MRTPGRGCFLLRVSFYFLPLFARSLPDKAASSALRCIFLASAPVTQMSYASIGENPGCEKSQPGIFLPTWLAGVPLLAL